VISDLGARAVVADSPGFGSAGRAARVSGMLEVCRRHGVPLLDLGDGPSRTVAGATYHSLELASEALDAGRLWNLAKWKTHTMMGLTLGVKNLYGCVPGKRKVSLHLRAGRKPDVFAGHLVDVWSMLRPCLTVLDGVVAMEGPGPSRGTPVARHLLLASPDAPALDWEATRLSGFSPDEVPTVAATLQRGLVAPGRLKVLGDDAEPVRFLAAPGSPSDFALPGPLKRWARAALSPAPRFHAGPCTGCGVCREACPTRALGPGAPPEFSPDTCIRCYCCHELCPAGAVDVPRRPLLRILSFVGRSGRRR
ncbi:MAG: DUF362 domain-containing protein, partial [Deltaproteobacteria bacterium]|nr:DUF362 domain-containing protein [Deltaproteobacteria bacterium]